MTSRLSRRWRNLLQRDRVDRDLDAELRATIDLLVDEKVRAGRSLDAARREAAVELGSVGAIKEAGGHPARVGGQLLGDG